MSSSLPHHTIKETHFDKELGYFVSKCNCGKELYDYDHPSQANLNMLLMDHKLYLLEDRIIEWIKDSRVKMDYLDVRINELFEMISEIEGKLENHLA